MVITSSLVACNTPVILYPGDDGYDDWEMQEDPEEIEYPEDGDWEDWEDREDWGDWEDGEEWERQEEWEEGEEGEEGNSRKTSKIALFRVPHFSGFNSPLASAPYMSYVSDLCMQPLDPDRDPPDDLREIGAYTYMQAKKLCATRSWLWIVEDLFPTRSINIISSEPKAGKSTLVRSLLYGVTNQEKFLGRVCCQGPAVYYSLEDQMDLTVEMLSRNLADADTRQPLYIIESLKSCKDILSHMRIMNKAVKPILFVIDTLQRGLLLADLNDYASVTVALDRFIEFVVNEAPNACIVFLHHNHKTRETEKGSTSANRIAGSVAIHGSVFTAMVMDVDDETGIRYIGTSQRRGTAMNRIPLRIDRNTLRIMLNTGASVAASSHSQTLAIMDSDDNASAPASGLIRPARSARSTHSARSAGSADPDRLTCPATKTLRTGNSHGHKFNQKQVVKIVKKWLSDRNRSSENSNTGSKSTVNSSAGMPFDELAKRFKGPQMLLRAAVNRLVEDGILIKTGRGTCGSPVILFLNSAWKEASP